MDIHDLEKIHPLTVKECQTVEDINARLSIRRLRSAADTLFYKQLAAVRGGIWDGDHKRFKSYYEYDPTAGTLTPARIRVSKFISEKSIIVRKGCIYLSGWNKEQVINQINQ